MMMANKMIIENLFIPLIREILNELPRALIHALINRPSHNTTQITPLISLLHTEKVRGVVDGKASSGGGGGDFCPLINLTTRTTKTHVLYVTNDADDAKAKRGMRRHHEGCAGESNSQFWLLSFARCVCVCVCGGNLVSD